MRKVLKIIPTKIANSILNKLPVISREIWFLSRCELAKITYKNLAIIKNPIGGNSFKNIKVTTRSLSKTPMYFPQELLGEKSLEFNFFWSKKLEIKIEAGLVLII
ncbi:hypothetical protein Ornrh_2292 [Ornithobacterium rhinotracheale DSM 15997]|uniref:Uncharacterized protein n=1 Tax=Ornithobacterium rhinotracheale (strain ATCC 51463 / DSM 15997 / CCUG 23171 / CIP 104009 / LMG 9086) TaxID=867902 RepID=I4A389_ORNRL|nr:hypothetical protein Ornrh_2292 [Ornithobacterium rhinotracheale DSM 15997]